MKTLIVTASSKSKCDETEESWYPTGISFAESLDDKYKGELYKARAELISELGISDGPDLQDTDIDKGNPEFIPAYLRYTGRTYSKISMDAWNNLLKNQDKFDCVILSALYGFIRFDEPIRNYEIKQVTKIPEISTVKTFWKNKGAMDWLFNYIMNNGFEKVIFVLSTSYGSIVQRDKLMKKLKAKGIETEDQQFKKFGMSSMLKRGEFINETLINA